MPTLDQTRAAVFQAIDAYADAIFTAQADRLAARGHYLQRQATHTAIPADGSTLAPDNLTHTPTDESETGSEYFTFPDQMHTCVTVNVSEGPQGKAFVCVFEFDWSATGMRQRYEITGPTRYDSGWSEYDPTASPIPA